MDTLRKDLVAAVRAARRSPLATALIVITLALGIGASTAMFTIVDAVLIRKLPYRDPERLVAVWLQPKAQPDQKMFATYRDYEELIRSARSFNDVAANTWAFAGSNMLWRGEPYRVLAIPATQNLFSLLGVDAELGRAFVPADVANGCAVVLADRFWREKLGGQRDVVGGSISLDDEACTVVGVMPASFEFFPRATEVWKVITPASPLARNPIAGVAIFARLAPGVSRAAAQAEVSALHKRIAEEAPAMSFVLDTDLAVHDLQGEFTFLAGSNLRTALLMLSAAVAMLLLICCVNVAGILLGRGAERQKELALRAALGSERSRLVRQLLTESVALAVAGACVGTVLAAGTVRLFRALTPIDLPVGASVGLNWQVLAFAVALTLVAAASFGLLPALKASRVDLNEVLKAAGASMTRSWLGGRGGRVLVAAELGLATVLLIFAGLLIRSIDRLTSVPLSFRTDHLLIASVTLPSGSYAEQAQRSRFFDAALDRIATLPGVESVALSREQPLAGQVGGAITIAGKQAPTSELGDVDSNFVSASYFRVMGVALLRGREFDVRDRGDAAPVAVVNQRFVDEYLPNEDPLGARIKIGLENGSNPWLTIVGIARNEERSNFFHEMSFAAPPIVYQPTAQQAALTMTLLVRLGSDFTRTGELLQREIGALDARVPVHGVTTLDDVLAKNFAQPRFRTSLLAAFAGLSLLLATIGVYGLLTRAVVQRTREIGIRIALGADRRRVVRSVVGESVLLASIGVVAGTLAATYLGRFLASMLYGVEPLDPATITITAGVLLVAATGAAYAPARRATRVDPIAALKQE